MSKIIYNDQLIQEVIDSEDKFIKYKEKDRERVYDLLIYIYGKDSMSKYSYLKEQVANGIHYIFLADNRPWRHYLATFENRNFFKIEDFLYKEESNTDFRYCLNFYGLTLKNNKILCKN